MSRFLIANTTREQREKIVKDALGYNEVGCEEGGRFGYEFYEPYINGEKEISELTQEYTASYVRGGNNSRNTSGCSYSR